MATNFLTTLSQRLSSRRKSPLERFPDAGLEQLANWTVENHDFPSLMEPIKTSDWQRINNEKSGLIHYHIGMSFLDRRENTTLYGYYTVTFDASGFPTSAAAVSGGEADGKIRKCGTEPNFMLLADLKDFSGLRFIQTKRTQLRPEMFTLANEAMTMMELPSELTMHSAKDWIYFERPSSVILKREVSLKYRAQTDIDHNSKATFLLEFDADGNALGAWLNTNRRKPIATLDAETLSNSGPSMRMG